MKDMFLLLILFIMASSFSAQFEIVKDITELTSDLTAQKYGHKDVNGQWCAILKVHTDIKDLQFEGFGYEKHDYWAESGIYLVYMQPESKAVRFIKNEFIAKNYTFPFKLKGNSVYQIDIKGVGEEKKIENIIITIQTVPSGGEIYFDGKNLGFVEQIETGVGPHEIKIKRSGYEDKTTNIQVSAKNNFFKVELVPLPGTIQLNKIKPEIDYSKSGMSVTAETGILLSYRFGNLSQYRDSLYIYIDDADDFMKGFGAGLKFNIRINKNFDIPIRMKIITFQYNDYYEQHNPEEYYITQEITLLSALTGIKYKFPQNFYLEGGAGISRVFFRFRNNIEDNDHQYDSWDFCYIFGFGYDYKKFDAYLSVPLYHTEYELLFNVGLSLGYKFWMF